MNRRRQEEFLVEHIPYRLRAIDLFRFACGVRLFTLSPKTVEICFDGKPVLIASNAGLITNPFLEVGLMFCRGMLEFLGITLDQQRHRLVPRRRRRKNDVVLEDFDLRRVPVAAACRAPLGAPRDVRRALVSTIRTSHKGVAHLTLGSPRQPQH